MCPKGPFSGSEVAFSTALPEGAAATERALDILGHVQVRAAYGDLWQCLCYINGRSHGAGMHLGAIHDHLYTGRHVM